MTPMGIEMRVWRRYPEQHAVIAMNGCPALQNAPTGSEMRV